jgi:two-component system response regulator YesN
MYKSKFSKIFRTFLISYMVILLIPLVSGFFSYRTSIDIAESSSIESSLSVLNQSKGILESRLAEIEGFTTQLNLNRDLNNLFYKQKADGSYNVYELWQTAKDIAAYSYTNDFLNHFYIYFEESNIILSPGSIFFRPKHFFELNKYDHISFDQWKAAILQGQKQRLILSSEAFHYKGERMSVITYVQPLPLGSFDKPDGTLVVLIDEQEIQNLFEPILLQFQGWAYIADQEGNILTSAGIKPPEIKALGLNHAGKDGGLIKFSKGDTIIISTQSTVNKWTYVAGIPEDVLLQQANKIKKITWGVTLATLLLGLLVSLTLAYRHSNPIHKILDIFKEQADTTTEKSKNVYDFLQGNISDLMSGQKSMEDALQRQRPLLRDAFIRRMIKGEFHSISEIEAAMSQIDLQFGGECGYAGIIQINGYGGMISKDILNELDASRLLIKQKLIKTENLHLVDLESDKIIFIITLPDKSLSNQKKHIEQIFTRLKVQVRSEYRISITVSLGSLFEDLMDVGRSFDEAKYALDYTAAQQNTDILWYESAVTEATTYYYPLDLELKLINAVKTGESEESSRIVAQVFKQNFTERQLSTEMAHQLINEMKGSLYKLLDPKLLQDMPLSENLKKQVEELKLSDSPEQVQGELERLLESFCQSVRKQKRESDHEMIQQVKDYIHEMYKDADLSLYRISEAVGRPEKYISQLFKERTGENLSDYLESVRFKKASELLAQTDKTIDEISQCVGYNSAQSFRRAFKRISGITPTSYRDTVN